MKLTEMSTEVLEFVKANGGRVAIDAICEGVGRKPRSVGANVTDLSNKKLVVREKVESEGDEKPVTFVALTDEGVSFVPSED